MALDFVGMDPDSQQDKCPAVYVDPASGDGLFVGKTVTDPLIVAEMNAHGSIGADEAVIRMPTGCGRSSPKRRRGTTRPAGAGLDTCPSPT